MYKFFDIIHKTTTSFYFLLTIIIIGIILLLTFVYWVFLLYYFKFKSRFWYLQPVFHLYDFQYYFYNKGIISKELPCKNEYTDFKNIESGFVKNVSKQHIDDFVHLIQKHYFKNKDNKYHPKKKNIMPYLHNSKSILTFYFDNDGYYEYSNNSVNNNKKIIGCMSSYPLNVFIKNPNMSFCVYYVDYLCVDKKYRGKKIAEKIIQTQEYTQRHLNKKISISLFKREDDLTGIIPLCIYKSYTFDMKNWSVSSSSVRSYDTLYNGSYKILLVDIQNLYFLNDFLNSMTSKNGTNGTNGTNENNVKFEVSVLMDIADLQEVVKTKNVFIYMMMYDNRVVNCYFFKKTCTFVTKNTQFLSLFASIQGKEDDLNLFIEGFKISLTKFMMTMTTTIQNPKNNNKKEDDIIYSHLVVEDISDNHLIIQNLKIKTSPCLVSPVAYFFYNFAYQPFNSNDVLIVA